MHHFNPPAPDPDWHVEWFGQLAIVTDLELRIVAVALVHRDEVVLAEDPPQPKAREYKHGTRNTYAQGCRCASCTSAHAAHQRELYQKRKARGISLRLSRAA